MTPPNAPANQPSTRLQALTNHLTSTTKMSTAEKKPPITCHVLDTTIGRPAPSIPVTLTLHSPPSTLAQQQGGPSPLTYTGLTNSDGRVTSWHSNSPSSSSNSLSLEEVFGQQGGDQKYELLFDTEKYFGERGIEAFFQEVRVGFVVREKQRVGEKREHFHVPVLLGPFGYTTYRGS